MGCLVRLGCRLRQLRGDRTLADIAGQVGIRGVTAAELSMIERGYELPRDEWVPALERAYGVPRIEWYDANALLAIQADEATG